MAGLKLPIAAGESISVVPRHGPEAPVVVVRLERPGSARVIIQAEPHYVIVRPGSTRAEALARIAAAARGATPLPPRAQKGGST